MSDFGVEMAKVEMQLKATRSRRGGREEEERRRAKDRHGEEERRTCVREAGCSES